MTVSFRRVHGPEMHRSERAGWLRAAVLGADDGIVSTASLVIGVAASAASRGTILTAGFAGMVAGATAMAVGEFVSVGSQRDVEQADLRREARELADDPEAELLELTRIYESRGLTPELARQVAVQLHQGDDLLAVHARDELGFTEAGLARPVQAAAVSALSFAAGAAIPVVVLAAAPTSLRIPLIAAVALVALGILGVLGAAAGRAPRGRAGLRVLVGGGLAMALTALVGKLVGTAV